MTKSLRRRLAMMLLPERDRSVLCRCVARARITDEDEPYAQALYDAAL